MCIDMTVVSAKYVPKKNIDIITPIALAKLAVIVM